MFEKPKEVSGMDCAFGPRKIKELLPDYKDVPEEFKQYGNKWASLVSKWFFSGLDVKKDLPPIKQGIDLNMALRHLGACLSSWEPKHEHKTAGVAYLMSLWFEDLP